MLLRRDAVAYILGMGATGLGVIRSLGRVAIPIVGVDFNAHAPGLRSKYCKPLISPDPTNEPEKTLKTLMTEAASHSEKGVLFPTADEFVLFVSRFRHELAEAFQYAAPAPEVLESIIDKGRQYKLARENNILCPRTFYPRSIRDIHEIKDVVEYPALIKPYYSHLWQEKSQLKGIRVNTPRQLVASFRDVSDPKFRAMVQSIVPGPYQNIIEVCAYLSSKREGEILALFVDRKIRQHPIDFGVGTCMDSVHDSEAVKIGLTLLSRINYRGVAAIEFKIDARNGSYKLLDLNARLWLQNILATQAGVNFPLVQYLDLTDQQVESQRDYKDGVLWLDAIQDFRAFRKLTGSTPRSLLNWLRLIRKADCHAYFAKDDVWPFLRQYTNVLTKLPRYGLRKRAPEL
jgi:predicted ATP-grasp superfamily ATP-dependent carboligase